MLEKRSRMFAWVVLACEAVFILYQIFGPFPLLSSPRTPLITAMVNILPICIFLAVIFGEDRRGICLVVGILCILRPFIETGILCFYSGLPIPMARAAFPRIFFEALPAILVGVALVLYARKRRFPYIGWYAAGTAVLYWLYGRVAEIISFRISGPSGRIMAWPFPLVDIIYILLAFAVQFLPNTVIASKRHDEREVSQ